MKREDQRAHVPGRALLAWRDSELLLEALTRSRRVMEEMGVEGTRVISCTLIPGEEVVFSVYEGPSADAVSQLNQRAGIAVSRIVQAIAVTGDLAD
jgi:Protein of unknown function (DUF4242)